MASRRRRCELRDKVPFFRLFERRSQKTGLTYFSGKLGDLKLGAFRQTDTPEADLYGAEAVWQVFASPADQSLSKARRVQSAARAGACICPRG